MKLLALDTSTEACSAALFLDGETLSRYEIAPKRHTELILPMIDNLLSESGLKLQQLDAIGFGRGPGAFTGVRIATGISQGLAFAADIPVVPVSSLAALSHGVIDKAEVIVAAIDARMEEIYYGIYRTTNGIELVGEEHVCPPDKIQIPDSKSCFGVGTGWLNYRVQLTEKLADRMTGYDGDRYPNAVDIAILAVAAFNNGLKLSAEEAQPVYLRDHVTDQ